MLIDDALHHGGEMRKRRGLHIRMLARFVQKPHGDDFFQVWIFLKFENFGPVHRPTLEVKRMY